VIAPEPTSVENAYAFMRAPRSTVGLRLTMVSPQRCAKVIALAMDERNERRDPHAARPPARGEGDRHRGGAPLSST
jgi:hypothetical protein